MPQEKDQKAPGYIGGTGRFSPESTLFDDGAFIIREGTETDEDGNKYPNAIAQRWYGGSKSGYPNCFGNAQWFLIPTELQNVIRVWCIARKLFKKEMNAFISNPNVTNSTRAQFSAENSVR